MSQIATDMELRGAVSNLTQQAERAIITTDQEAEKAADLVKIIKTQLKKIDEHRKRYTAPLNQSLREINGDAKKLSEPLSAAARRLGDSLNAWLLRKQQEAEEAARKAREAAEARALAEAEDLQQQGDQAGADHVMETIGTGAAILEHEARPDRVRGGYGATASLTMRWDFEITDQALVPERFKTVNLPAIREFVRTVRHEVQQAAPAEVKGKALDLYIDKELEKRLKVPGIAFAKTGSAVVR